MRRFRVEKALGLHWGRQLVRNNNSRGFLSGGCCATHITNIKPSQPHRHVGTGTGNLRLTDAVSHFASTVLKAKEKIPPSLPTASPGGTAADLSCSQTPAS